MPSRVDEVKGIQQSLIGSEPFMKIGRGIADFGRQVSDAVDRYTPQRSAAPKRRMTDIRLPNRSGKVDPRLRTRRDRTSSR